MHTHTHSEGLGALTAPRRPSWCPDSASEPRQPSEGAGFPRRGAAPGPRQEGTKSPARLVPASEKRLTDDEDLTGGHGSWP